MKIKRRVGRVCHNPENKYRFPTPKTPRWTITVTLVIYMLMLTDLGLGNTYQEPTRNKQTQDHDERKPNIQWQKGKTLIICSKLQCEQLIPMDYSLSNELYIHWSGTSEYNSINSLRFNVVSAVKRQFINDKCTNESLLNVYNSHVFSGFKFSVYMIKYNMAYSTVYTRYKITFRIICYVKSLKMCMGRMWIITF